MTQAWEADKYILLASTIGPTDAGIVPLLEENFEKETGIRVRHVGAGTGEALKLAEKVNAEDSATFVKWLVSPDKGQRIIRDFGIEKYGAPMFFPDSREWHALQDKK